MDPSTLHMPLCHMMHRYTKTNAKTRQQILILLEVGSSIVKLFPFKSDKL